MTELSERYEQLRTERIALLEREREVIEHLRAYEAERAQLTDKLHENWVAMNREYWGDDMTSSEVADLYKQDRGE